MKNHIFIFVLGFLLINSSIKGQDSVNIGIGISLNPNLLFTNSETPYYSLTSPANFYLLINSSHFRLEPEVGFYSFSNRYAAEYGSDDYTSSILRIGIGLFYILPIESSFDIYFGPRFGFLLRSSTSRSYTGYYSSGEFKKTQTDFFMGICTGAEYFFSNHFSIGGEIQFNYLSLGNPEYTPQQGSSTNSTTVTFTNALMFFRWYF